MKTIKKYKRYEVRCDGRHHWAYHYRSKQLEKIQICSCDWIKNQTKEFN